MRIVFGVAVLAALVLAGCMGPEPPVTPPPTSTAAPVFASEEEALAAAAVVFAKFLDAETRLGNSSGTDLSGFESVVTSKQLAEEIAYGADLEERGRTLVGSFAYFGLKLQQLDQSNPPGVFLQAYVCIDLTNVTYVDAAGDSVSTPGTNAPLPFEIVFVDDADADHGSLLVDEVSEWSGTDFCS